MGESKQRLGAAQREVTEVLGLETAGGRLQVRWDRQAQATPFGQMAFFIEFLISSGIFARWVEDCPLRYRSGNGSSVRDIVGTWLLSILAGHWRYAHVSAIRCDGVNPALLGMERVVSEDSVRRALKALDEEAGTQWLKRHIEQSVVPLLYAPWILDVDVTVKPLYGHQEGALIGFNPHKPGRPSHAYHSYQVSGLRMLFGVDVLAGNRTPMNHTLPGLLEVLDGLPAEKRPRLVRGDSGLSGEAMLEAL